MGSLIKVRAVRRISKDAFKYYVYINPSKITSIEIEKNYQPIIYVGNKRILCQPFSSIDEIEKWLVELRLFNKRVVKHSRTSKNPGRFKGDRFMFKNE